MIDIWIPRSINQALITAGKLQDENFNIICEPLIKIELFDQHLSPFLMDQDVIITSQNAIHALKLIQPHCRVFTIGSQTYHDVIALKRFDKIYNADGNHQALTHLIQSIYFDQDKPLLYLRGYHVTQKLEQLLITKGFKVNSLICYQAHPIKHLSAHLINLIKTSQHGIILIYSTRQAQILKDNFNRHGLTNDLHNWYIIGLSEACTAPIKSLDFKQVDWANCPHEESLLEKMREYYV